MSSYFLQKPKTKDKRGQKKIVMVDQHLKDSRRPHLPTTLALPITSEIPDYLLPYYLHHTTQVRNFGFARTFCHPTHTATTTHRI